MKNELIEVIKKHEKLIAKIAHKFYGLEFADLCQVGVIGLIKAYRNYKPSSNAKFSSYAYEYIFGEMYKLSLETKSFKVNKETLQLSRKLEEARRSLTQAINRVPNNYELASFLNMDVDLVNNALNSTASLISLDSTSEDEDSLYEAIPDKVNVNIDDSITIMDSMDKLPTDEKNILFYRYFKDFTQSETANILGLTQASVSRYEKKGLEKMGAFMA